MRLVSGLETDRKGTTIQHVLHNWCTAETTVEPLHLSGSVNALGVTTLMDFEPTTSQTPFLSDQIPAFSCPNCHEEFSSGNEVVGHLSAESQCGRWLVQSLPDSEQQASHSGAYNDDSDVARDGRFTS